MCHDLLRTPKFYELLELIDEERAQEVRAAGCSCGGVLHRLADGEDLGRVHEVSA